MKDAAGGTRSYVMRERARTTAQTGERILDAAAELFVERPLAQLTLGLVAERAGVTVQTVIRRFGDKEGLIAEAAARGVAHVRAQRDEAPVGDVAGAVDNLAEHYEQAGQTALRMLDEEHASSTIGELTEQGRALHRDWCARVFAPWLAPLERGERTRRLAQFVAVCDVYTWRLLRHDSGLSRRQYSTAVVELLEGLIAR